MKIKYITTLILITFLMSCMESQGVKEAAMKDLPSYDQPVTEKTETVTDFHGEKLKDNYSWLKDKSRKNKRVLDQIDKENNYTKKYFSGLSGLEKKVYKEIVSKIDQTDMSVPVKIDDYFYYSRDIEGEQYPVYCRRHKSMDELEEVLLDLNKMSKEHDYFELGVYKISPDHRFLAYSIDTSGDERFTLYVKYLERNTLFPEVFENVDDLVWAEDNNTFFYTTVNENDRSDTVLRHVVGTGIDSDRKMYGEPDESFYVWVEKTKDRKYVLIGTANKNTSEIYYINSKDPMSYFDLISPRKDGIEYYVEHHDKDFYILTNADKAFNFKIMKVADNFPYRDRWEDYFPHREEVYIEDFDLFKNRIVISEIADGKKVLRVAEYSSLSSQEIKFNDDCYNVYTSWNPNYNSSKLRYVFESMVTPYSIVDYDMISGKKEFLKQQNVLGGYDRMEYNSELVYAYSYDHKEIPISIVYKRDLFKNDGSNPLLLEGYGAYGTFNESGFSISRLSLLNRGVVYAIAHVRGGLEKGKKWHLDGMLLNKKNTFSDFVSCAEYLIKERYTTSDKLVITGASAGGMLIGAALNLRPDLFKAAVLEVPFLDVLNTMLDSTLAATVSEYDEWGDPHQKDYFDYIRSYCPYQNITLQFYPEIYVKAGFNDPRVNYWEPAKWVAKIREYNAGDTNVLLSITDTGHGGSSGRFDYYKEIANTYAYVLYQMGITF